MASPRPVEMLALAELYGHAGAVRQAALLATGDGMLATWMGVRRLFFFNLVTLLIFAVLMLRSAVYTRATAVLGLVAAILMAVTVTSNFGTVGLAFALASLVPWSIFAVMVALRLFHLVHAAGEPSRRYRPSST